MAALGCGNDGDDDDGVALKFQMASNCAGSRSLRTGTGRRKTSASAPNFCCVLPHVLPRRSVAAVVVCAAAGGCDRNCFVSVSFVTAVDDDSGMATLGRLARSPMLFVCRFVCFVFFLFKKQKKSSALLTFQRGASNDRVAAASDVFGHNSRRSVSSVKRGVDVVASRNLLQLRNNLFSRARVEAVRTREIVATIFPRP